MNTQIKSLLVGLVAFAAGGLLMFYVVRHPPRADADDKDQAATTSPVQLKHTASGESILVIDTATQERLGLKIENPVALKWQPEVKGFGSVIDPATLSTAVADLESARTAAEASGRESNRLKTLAEQNNASARVLEAARATSTHDQLGFESTRAKFALDWGNWLADQTNLATLVQQLSGGEATFIRVDLPAGQVLPSPPASARIVALTDETKSVNGELFSATVGVNPTTQSQSFFYLVKNQPLTPGAAVTGFLQISGSPLDGVIVSSAAVLRYEGKGWIYVQNGSNDFTRTEISLDHPAENGWFVSGNLTATNRVVVGGAQTVLSAELSGGNFNSGSRD